MAVDNIARGLAGNALVKVKQLEIVPTTYIEVADAVTITQELEPNVFYKFLTLDTCTTLTITLASGLSNVYNVYAGKFTTGTTPPTFTAIAGVTWVGGFPTLSADTTYEFSIVDGIGIIAEL